MLVRGREPEATMSRYLVDRIAAQAQYRSRDRDGSHRAGRPGRCARSDPLAPTASGDGNRARDPASVPVHRRRSQHRLAGAIGHRARRQGLRAHRREIAGTPALETSRAGVFAIGDVRSGSIKRVAAAVGEGAQVVAALHAYLARQLKPANRANRGRSPMTETCTHLDTIRDVTPSALGCEECLKIGLAVGAFAAVPDLRPCRLLRQLAQPARHQAFSRDPPSHHRRLRSARRLGLVLCR